MQLTYTLIDRTSGFERDIIVPADQTIFDTIRILIDNGCMHNVTDETIRVKSLRTGLYVDMNSTYEENGIYNGDKVEIL